VSVAGARGIRVVGVDLAWGVRNGTGVCVVDDGCVLDSACLRSDDAIVSWIRQWDAGELLVAFDAPLIVRNRTGRRACENVIASAFAAEHAVPYPANLTLLGGHVRAARIARRLRLRMAPAPRSAAPLRAAIEVFPHPALVVFLSRNERLPYKAKQGRALAVRHAAMAELVQGLLDFKRADPSLDVTTSPAWPRLASAIAAAPGASLAALKRAEDELDAYVCAYIGWYHLAWAGTRSLTIGDGREGYIVTPVTPRHAALVRERAAATGVAVS
jgi:predicted RNase H-like nuclease